MKANELRIGNWFIQYDEPEEFDGDFYHLSDIKFIPLTEEWILKFGFVKTIDAYFYNDYCIEDIHNGVTWVISEFDHLTNEFTAFGRCINYVHQLQNLYFALTGEELTFKSE